MIRVDVDTAGNYTVGPSQTHSVDTKETLHLGGVPGESEEHWVAVAIELPVSDLGPRRSQCLNSQGHVLCSCCHHGAGHSQTAVHFA